MSKGKYHSVHFQDANDDTLAERFEGAELVVTVDVAKHEMYTGLAEPSGELARLVTWANTDELQAFVGWVESLGAEDVTLVLEPSGTYGEPVRQAARDAGWRVYLVSPKRLNDAAEVFDGVPSLHDAKSAWLLAKLHAEDLSQPWGADGEAERRLAAHLSSMTRYGEAKRRNLGKLEAELGRFWPEVTTHVAKDSATLLALLEEFGGPGEIAARPEEAQALMKRASCGSLSPETREAIVESARETVGQRMYEAEREALADLARTVDEQRRRERTWKSKVEEEVESYEDAEAVGEVVGDATAGVFRSKVGDFREYDSPEALLKTFGLNLKEKSSGTHQGELKITKRGPAAARSYLYWATLRKIHDNPVFRAWHTKKVERDGGVKSKSVVALMRKLVKALWHVARGETFDATQLFDVNRLESYL